MHIRKGFTLIELLVVIAIITIIYGIIRPTLNTSASKTREFECEANLKQIAMAMHAYAEEYGSFPVKLDAVDSILKDKSLLLCPGTSEKYHYHRPKGDAGRDDVIVSCCDPNRPMKRHPHRSGTGYLILTAGGKVGKVINDR